MRNPLLVGYDPRIVDLKFQEKLMKNVLGLFIAFVLFAGCEKIEGQLNVTSELKLRTSKDIVKTIALGTYSADIKANTKKKITLRLNNDSDEKYEFNIPKGSLPSNGTFAYKANVVGQAVDLAGSVNTNILRSEVRQTYESCQYQEPVQICRPLPNGGYSCSIYYQTRFGRKWIQYYEQTTDKQIDLSLFAQDSSVESARFLGSANWVDRIIVSESQCSY